MATDILHAMERIRLSPTAIASIIAALIVVISIAASFVIRLLNAQSLSLRPVPGTLASACTSNPQNDKVYFVSCGGTF